MNRNVIRFSDHAVERFIERFARGMSIGQARAWLEQEGPQAIRLKTKTALGQEQWELQDPKCILVIKNSNDAGRMCKTILFSRPENFGGFTEDEMEIIREASERMPPMGPTEHTHNYTPKAPSPPKAARAVPSIKAIIKTAPSKEHQTQALEIQKQITERFRVTESAKTKRHIATMEENIAKQKKCIRATLRYLLAKAAEGDARAIEIAEAVQAIEPGFLTEGFMAAQRTG